MGAAAEILVCAFGQRHPVVRVDVLVWRGGRHVVALSVFVGEHEGSARGSLEIAVELGGVSILTNRLDSVPSLCVIPPST